MLLLALLLNLCMSCLAEESWQKPQAEPPVPTRRTSEAARHNPAVRSYFAERYVQTGAVEVKEREDVFREQSLDNLIDMNTAKVLDLVDRLHEERDKVQSGLTLPMLALFEKGHADTKPISRLTFGPTEASLRVRELQGYLKKIEELAKDIDSELVFLRFALDVSLEYKLDKATLSPGALIRRDLEDVVSTVPLLEMAVDDFYFPRSSSVTLYHLKEGSIPRLLQKIRKIAARAHATLQNLL